MNRDPLRVMLLSSENRSQKRILFDPGQSVRRMFGATGSMIERVVPLLAVAYNDGAIEW